MSAQQGGSPPPITGTYPRSEAKVAARTKALESLLIEKGLTSGVQGEDMVCVENTPTVHNVIVCTLCSCYPRPVLGLPPNWYKSRAYRSRAVREPRALLREFGTSLPDGIA